MKILPLGNTFYRYRSHTRVPTGWGEEQSPASPEMPCPVFGNGKDMPCPLSGFSHIKIDITASGICGIKPHPYRLHGWVDRFPDQICTLGSDMNANYFR